MSLNLLNEVRLFEIIKPQRAQPGERHILLLRMVLQVISGEQPGRQAILTHEILVLYFL